MMNNKLTRILFLMLLVLAFAGCSGSTAPTSRGVTPTPSRIVLKVDVTLSDGTLRASQTTFAMGIPYHFAVKNEGQVAREFLIVPALWQRSVQSHDQLALYHITASQLPPKGTSSFAFTFTKPAAQGQLEFASLLPGHNEVEMKLPITVNFNA